jgi:thiamine biosynthesis protein ThiC
MPVLKVKKNGVWEDQDIFLEITKQTNTGVDFWLIHMLISSPLVNTLKKFENRW